MRVVGNEGISDDEQYEDAEAQHIISPRGDYLAQNKIVGSVSSDYNEYERLSGDSYAAGQQKITEKDYKKMKTKEMLKNLKEKKPKIWMVIVRLIFMILDLIWVVGIIALIGYYYFTEYTKNDEFTVIKTMVTEQNDDIRYAKRNHTVMKYFLYRTNKINTTKGITITSDMYAITADLENTCAGDFEYYSGEEDATKVHDYISKLMIYVTFCLIAFLLLVAGLTKFPIYKVWYGEIPFFCKKKIRSKWVFERFVHLGLSLAIVVLHGLAFPLFAINYDNNCYISNISDTMLYIFALAYAIGMCLLFLLIPLLLMLIQIISGGLLKVLFFAILWLEIPLICWLSVVGWIYMFKVVIDNDTPFLPRMGYVFSIAYFGITIFTTMFFVFLTNKDYLRKQEEVAEREMEARPPSQQVSDQ